MCLLTEALKVGYVTYVIRIMTRGCSIVTDFRGSLSGHSFTGPKITTSGGGIELRSLLDYCHAVTKGVARCARALPKAERTGIFQYL